MKTILSPFLLKPAISNLRSPISLLLCCAMLLFCAPEAKCQGQEDGSPEVIAADIIIVRPVCLVATVVGSALFLVSLPIAIATKSTNDTAEKLVAVPGRATFTRRLGDMSSLSNP